MERWRPVVGYEQHYEVSDLGRVRSIDRWITRRIGRGRTPDATRTVFARSHVLKPGMSNGYPTVSLCTGEGRRRTYCLHDLVLNAFIGPRPTGQVGRHLDGDKTRNLPGNLAWGTHADNAADMLRHGRRVMGEAYPTAKLTDATAAEVRALKGIVPQSVLAERYRVSPAAIQAVHDRRTWKHVAVDMDAGAKANARHRLKQRGM